MNDGLTAYLGSFVDELVRSGVRDTVISPGSRSTPIALLAAEHPRMRTWTIVDERSAAFFALGLAKAKRGPVALLCTSGTAAANYYPAVAEAFIGRVPLVVLTADRPHELREVGAPQTIRQIGAYGDHVKWFFEMPIPEADDNMIRHARMTASRAAAVSAAAPQGPVHLNFPLREPLLPNLSSPSLWSGGREEERTYTIVSGRSGAVSDEQIGEAVAEWSAHERGVIICGPHDEPGYAEAVASLAELLQYPILSDPLSQLRSGRHPQDAVIDGYDAFLRDERTAALLAPEVIVRFGAMPVSKALLQYIQRHPNARMTVVDEGEGWRDPTLLAARMISAEPGALCRAAAERLHRRVPHRNGSGWMNCWRELQEMARSTMGEALEFQALFEGRTFMELRELLPSGSVLYVGNSMPIRDLDTFFAATGKDVRILGNRGANGIDGLISSALGASVSGAPTVLVLGDLAFHHDMSGLLAAKLHGLSLTIVLINNDGGGIFSFLPQAELPERRFEQLFGTPAGLDYAHAAAMYGGVFTRIASWEQFRSALARSFAEGGLHIIEIPTERRSNVAMHRELQRRLAERLAAWHSARS